MEDLIKLEVHHGKLTAVMSIDNSTEFKEFSVDIMNETDSRISSIEIQLNNEGVVINGTKLFPRELELLKEFLNQKI